jgi:short-subunit dehydrogenase
MSQIAGSRVLITGGAQGLGRGVAELLLQKGVAHVILWDIQPTLLEQTVAELQTAGHSVEGEIVDVAHNDGLVLAARRVVQRGPVDILINNAGVIVGKPFVAHTHAEIDRTMDVNASALMHLSLALLPQMIERGSGHIVNIASAAGMGPNPNMSVYCGSKAAVIGWSETLRVEMDLASTGVKVTTVTPYYIDTGMFAGVQSPLLPLVKTAYAARAIVRGIERDKIYVRMPLLIYAMPLLRGLMPARLYDLIAGKGLRVYRTMDKFKGRT